MTTPWTAALSHIHAGSDWTSSVVVADRADAGDGALAVVADERRVRACAGMTILLGGPAATICAHGACDVQPPEPGGAGR